MDVFLPFDQLIPTMRTVTVPVSQRRKFQGGSVSQSGSASGHRQPHEQQLGQLMRACIPRGASPACSPPLRLLLRV